MPPAISAEKQSTAQLPFRVKKCHIEVFICAKICKILSSLRVVLLMALNLTNKPHTRIHKSEPFATRVHF